MTPRPSVRGGSRMPDHSGIRLPQLPRRFTPVRPGRDTGPTTRFLRGRLHGSRFRLT